jgi:Ca-activated chloride channel family protein
MLRKSLCALCLAWLLAILVGCSGQTDSNKAGDPGSSASVPASGAVPEFRIVSGSENQTLQPLLDRFGTQNGIRIRMDYRGSVDIMTLLESGAKDIDAVWPANSLWITLGDTQRQVKEAHSIFWSPVVFGVKQSVARSLGWIRKEVRVEDILKAAEGGRLRYMMTSATQSNSGASAYLGYLYAFAGKPDMLTASHLRNAGVQGKIKRILGTVNRSAGSSGFLKDLFLQKYDNYDAMVNYEAVVIETNRALVAQGKEPLMVIYPADGLAIADSPLGYVDQNDPGKAAIFKKLQEYLLSDAVQQEILKQGRRIGPVGVELKGADTAFFNPNWGINLSRFLAPIKYPKAEVIREALDLYQTSFRKPSYTVYCLDFSGSMKGEREEGLKTAMQNILEQARAKKSLLQATAKDVTVVITFSDHILNEWKVEGNSPAKMNELWANIQASSPDGGTDIYTPVMRGLDLIHDQADRDHFFPSIILMTDGESNTGASFDEMQAHRQQTAQTNVPVFAIQFGEASPDQLKRVATETQAKLFDGKSDLSRAFRDAKGYN